MHTVDYSREKTGLLLVDPYNDFLSTKGKFWPRTREVAEEVNLLTNLKSVVDAARQTGVRIFIVPIIAGNRATTPIGSTRLQGSSPGLRTRSSRRYLGR
jgi:nicotinamidase-related amidase